MTRLEDQIKSGSFTVTPVAAAAEPEEERPPFPDDRDVPPESPSTLAAADETPVGFWTEICSQIRKELKPPVSAFFVPSPNGPIQGILMGNVLQLICANEFAKQMIDKPDILELVSRKASAKLGRMIRVKAFDKNATNEPNQQMEQLLQFSREHPDVIKIK